VDAAEQLLLRAQTGDRGALDALLLQHQPDVVRFARRLCRSSEDAEEAAQHALIAVFQHVGSFRRAARFTTWLFTVVRRECERRLRRQRPHGVPIHLLDPAGASGADDDGKQAEIMEAVAATLMEVSADERAILLLRIVEGVDGVEAAHRLGLTLAAQKSRLLRARAALRSRLVERLAYLEGTPLR
jgi:RNA polymerase sigma factor (sigma-70 family)